MSSSFFRFAMRHAVLAVTAISSALFSANELESLVKEGQGNSPVVLAARYQVEQALLKHEELAEFFDPSFFGAVGKADTQRDLPLQTGYTELTDKAFDTQVGLEVPVSPGAYVSLGAANRILQDPEGYDTLYQTMFGVRVRIPLLRDRYFKSLELSRTLTMAEYTTAVSNLLKTTQELRHDIELAYILAYENLAAYRITQDATRRFQKLYDEARELNRLKVVPDYQIHHSLLELQIGRDDEARARTVFEVSLENLAKLIGATRKLALAGDQNSLLVSAGAARDLPEISEELSCQARGSYQTIQGSLAYARVQLDTAQEEKRDDVSLQFGLSGQGEDEHHPLGMKELVTDRHFGGEISLVWRRRIDYRGPKAREARHRARIQELNENLRNEALNIHQAIATARLHHASAVSRLELVNQGIAAAKRTLDAELERFSLGENTSTNVTDAQKNLTTIMQRQATAAADLLRAKADYRFATGYRDQPPPPSQPDSTQRGNP
ncbi:MAG: TolC family protein [Victivallales bacterium]|nr:TolC family protein [Victivallales bacterium]